MYASRNQFLCQGVSVRVSGEIGRIVPSVSPRQWETVD